MPVSNVGELGDKLIQEFNLDARTVVAGRELGEPVSEHRACFVYHGLGAELGMRRRPGAVSEAEDLDTAAREVLGPILDRSAVAHAPVAPDLVVELLEHLQFRPACEAFEVELHVPEWGRLEELFVDGNPAGVAELVDVTATARQVRRVT